MLGSALYNKISTAGTVTTYYQKAPQSGTPPFCIISFVNANDDYVFSKKGVQGDYFVKVISDKNFPEQAIVLYSSIHDILQDVSLTIPGYSVIKIRRESLVQYEDQFHFWNVGGLYNLEIWQT